MRFRGKNFPHTKTIKLTRIVECTSLRNKTHVASDVFFFHVEILWAENTNPQHRHAPFAISKKNFSEKFYITQKLHHEYFETYG